MATAKDAIAEARRWIGTAEKPENNVVFNTEYYGHAVSGSAYPWCVVFLWYIFRALGASNLFYGGKRTAYAPTLMNWFIQEGRFFTAPKPGDIVFYNFGNGKTPTHVGLVVEPTSNGVVAIEGNTGSMNQTNGGMVQEKKRLAINCLGFGRPVYDDEPIVPFEPYSAIVDIQDRPDNELNVRTGPGAGYPKLKVGGKDFGLPRGFMVAILEEKNGWGRLADVPGWVSLDYMRR